VGLNVLCKVLDAVFHALKKQTKKRLKKRLLIVTPMPQVMPVAAAPLPVDASKVTASGTGLHQANVTQEMSFIVDGSQSGMFVSCLLVIIYG